MDENNSNSLGVAYLPLDQSKTAPLHQCAARKHELLAAIIPIPQAFYLCMMMRNNAEVEGLPVVYMAYYICHECRGNMERDMAREVAWIQEYYRG